MTIQDLIDEVKQEIEARDLAYRYGANNRMRYKVYQKYYLMHYLRKHKLTLQEIAIYSVSSIALCCMERIKLNG